MNIYHYDKATFEYYADGFARKSPLDNEWLIPAYATTIQPPMVIPGQIQCFIDGAWIIYDDHRGKVVYLKSNGSAYVVDFIGIIPNIYTDKVPCKFPIWVDDDWISDPVKLAEEQAEAERIAAKIQAIADNLPSWAQIAGELNSVRVDIQNATTLAMVRPAILALVTIVEKTVRIVYWLAKDKAD